jgi:chorismate mutase/prephenate dehydratase
MNLEESRRQIDELDATIVELLNRRATMARRIGRIKMQAGLPILDREREEFVLRRVVHENTGEIDDGSLIRIYRQILSECRLIQNIAIGEMAAGETVQ